MNAKFSNSEALRIGWRIAIDNILFFVGLFFLAFVALFAPRSIAALMESNRYAWTAGAAILAMILQTIISVGYLRIALDLTAGKKGGFEDLFTGWDYFGRYLLGSMLYSLVVLVGFLLLIVPGVIWAVKYQFYPYFIIDQDCGVIESFQKSAVATDGVKTDLCVLGCLFTGINLLGLLAFGVGLLITIPTTMIALAFVYRKLAPAPV